MEYALDYTATIRDESKLRESSPKIGQVSVDNLHPGKTNFQGLTDQTRESSSMTQSFTDESFSKPEDGRKMRRKGGW